MFDFIQSKDHIELALEAAIQSMVLLKNDPNNGLPITSPYKKACVSLDSQQLIKIINCASTVGRWTIH